MKREAPGGVGPPLLCPERRGARQCPRPCATACDCVRPTTPQLPFCTELVGVVMAGAGGEGFTAQARRPVEEGVLQRQGQLYAGGTLVLGCLQFGGLGLSVPICKMG